MGTSSHPQACDNLARCHSPSCIFDAGDYVPSGRDSPCYFIRVQGPVCPEPKRTRPRFALRFPNPRPTIRAARLLSNPVVQPVLREGFLEWRNKIKIKALQLHIRSISTPPTTPTLLVELTRFKLRDRILSVQVQIERTNHFHDGAFFKQ